METNTVESSKVERRATPRITTEYLALLRGQNDEGDVFQESGQVLNLSTGGIYVLIQIPLPLGSALSVKIALSTDENPWKKAYIAARGNVVRAEPLEEGLTGIAVKFTSYKFL